MKKLTAILFSVMIIIASASALAVVPTKDAYSTVLDWSAMADTDLNGGGQVTVFSDLTYYGVSAAGTQSIKDGRFSINVEEGEFENCYQFSFDKAMTDDNRATWAASAGLRFYLENNTGNEFTMSLNLFLDSSEVGYNRPYTSASGVWAITDKGEKYEFDFRFDDSFAERFFYVPEDFKGWVIIPATFAQDENDFAAGWMASYWSISEGIDYSIASMDLAGGLGMDIRADGVTSGSIEFGNLELYGEGELFTTPKESEVLAPGTSDQPTEQPSGQPTETTGATVGTTEAPTTQPTSIWAIVGIVAGVVVIVAIVAVVIVVNKKKKSS